jgi:glyoxalase family protein
MTLELGGLHHVSAITGDAPGNYDFYTRVLGMRLVKKTVNQDDVSAYHLFYSDRTGRPGTDLTFFDFAGAVPNRPGAGSIETIAFSVVGRAALDWWMQRFDALGVAHDPIVERAGRATLPFRDPEGQRLELVAIEGAEAEKLPGEIWPDSPVPAEDQIRGLHAVRIAVGRQKQSEFVLTEVLGFRPKASYTLENGDQVQIFEVGPGGSGAEVHVVARNDGSFARPGAGGVHHVAFRTPNDATHLEWQKRVTAAGLHATPQIDRFYFRALYFREPSGVLFEISTDGPGFTTDEPVEHLGETLALPPFLEPDRARIEAGLRPLDTARHAATSR